MPKIALCTTCAGRAEHLTQTLPKNIQDRNGHTDSVFVLLDYNSQDGLADYIQREHRADMDSGTLVYYRNPEPQQFHMAHAKNMAHRLGVLEGADILVNLDADNWTGNGFAAYVDDKFSAAAIDQEEIFLGTRRNHQGPGHLVRFRVPQGTAGRIVVSRTAFFQSGGYDEIFSEWSPDDKDFGMRLTNIGYMWRNIRPEFLNAIRHGQKIRERRYKEVEYNGGLGEGFVLRNRQHLSVVNDGVIGTGVVYRNFSSEPIEIRRVPTRIFGIGMHKTGTTSLAQAFKILGYDSAHWENSYWAKNIWNEMKDKGRSRTLEGHYALCDLPIPLLFKELDVAYPGSKFILTIRNEDQWIDSIRIHWAAMRAGWDHDVFSNQIHKLVYGTTEFDEAVFRARYRKHNADVIEYFRGRNDLLVMDLSNGAGWRELCPFLDRPMIYSPFPRKHQTANQIKYKISNGTS